MSKLFFVILVAVTRAVLKLWRGISETPSYTRSLEEYKARSEYKGLHTNHQKFRTEYEVKINIIIRYIIEID